MVDVIREFGHLEKLAKEDTARRFDRLYRLLRQEQFLALVKERIAKNKGANTPGVDGQVMDDITLHEITRLSQELGAGTYQPQPVRRRYIPKRNSKRLRPLGIPASRDKVVQAGVALILETLYEPLFRPCSHGFRPEHSPITALRQVSVSYRAGATWIIEGDIADCFGSIPHQVILNCLRKRIRDERFIDLVRKMLQAGVIEEEHYTPSYSGTPQGGIASPILANIVLHELDNWIETQWKANPPSQSYKDTNARCNLEYRRLYDRIARLRRHLDGKIPMPKGTTLEELRCELREKLPQLRRQPSLLPRKVTYYTRFADDFLIVLCGASKEEARQMKTAMAEWMQTTLGLTLSQEKTLITHWQKHLRFLGYELEGRTNPNGTRWLHLNVPKAAVREVVAKIQRATSYPQAPEYDVFTNVNAVARGWTNYYRFAHDSSAIGGKLSMVVFWRTVHYLGRRHRRSIAKMMRSHYGQDPKTGRKALFIYRPDKPPSPETRYFIWHRAPRHLSLAGGTIAPIQDKQVYINTDWATGRSQHKRLETRAAAGNACQHCGATGEPLFVHHPNRLSKRKQIKKGSSHVAESGMMQQTKLLCRACHLAHHHHNTRQ